MANKNVTTEEELKQLLASYNKNKNTASIGTNKVGITDYAKYASGKSIDTTPTTTPTGSEAAAKTTEKNLQLGEQLVNSYNKTTSKDKTINRLGNFSMVNFDGSTVTAPSKTVKDLQTADNLEKAQTIAELEAKAKAASEGTYKSEPLGNQQDAINYLNNAVNNVKATGNNTDTDTNTDNGGNDNGGTTYELPATVFGNGGNGGVNDDNDGNDGTTSNYWDYLRQRAQENYDAGVARLDSSKQSAIDKLTQQRQNDAEYASVIYQKVLKYLPDQLRNAGLNRTGYAESSFIDAGNNYAQNLGTLAQNYANNVSDVEQSYADSLYQLQSDYGTSRDNIALAEYKKALEDAETAKTEAAENASTLSTALLTPISTKAQLGEFTTSDYNSAIAKLQNYVASGTLTDTQAASIEAQLQSYLVYSNAVKNGTSGTTTGTTTATDSTATYSDVTNLLSQVAANIPEKSTQEEAYNIINEKIAPFVSNLSTVEQAQLTEEINGLLSQYATYANVIDASVSSIKNGVATIKYGDNTIKGDITETDDEGAYELAVTSQKNGQLSANQLFTYNNNLYLYGEDGTLYEWTPQGKSAYAKSVLINEIVTAAYTHNPVNILTAIGTYLAQKYLPSKSEKVYKTITQ